MDFLNKAFAQLAELFRSMTPGARITAALLLVVVVVSLAYLFNHEIGAQDSYLLGGQAFSADEITAMQGALGKAQLNDFALEGNRIRIPSGKQAAYLAALADGGALPAAFTDIFSEATAKTTPFTNRQQQVDNMKTAKKKGLAMIIRGMSGVETAEVDFDREEKSGLKRERITTALVAVKLRGGQTLEEDRVPHFQRLVAGAIAGLAPQDVTVLDKSTGMSFGGRGTSSAGGAYDDPYRDRKRKYQADWEETIRKALSYVSGVTVSADVELDREMRHAETRVKVDPKTTVAVRRSEETDNSTTEGPAPNGRPGVVAQGGVNQPGSLAGGASGGPKSTDKKASTTEEIAPSHDQTTMEMAGLTPKRVAISVGVPTSYFENIWRQRNPPAAGEEPKTPSKADVDEIQTQEIARIRQHVATLIPKPDPTVDVSQLVTVTPFSHLVTPDAPEPTLAESALSWFGASWSTLGLTGLALVSLLMLRSMVRAVPVSPTVVASAAPTPGQPAPERGAEPGGTPKARLKRRLGTGQSLRDELADIVREDPDAAASILRSWIGNVN